MVKCHLTKFVQNVNPKIKFLKFKLLVKLFLPGWDKNLGLVKSYLEEIQNYLHV